MPRDLLQVSLCRMEFHSPGFIHSFLGYSTEIFTCSKARQEAEGGLPGNQRVGMCVQFWYPQGTKKGSLKYLLTFQGKIFP